MVVNFYFYFLFLSASKGLKSHNCMLHALCSNDHVNSKYVSVSTYKSNHHYFQCHQIARTAYNEVASTLSNSMGNSLGNP